MKYVPLIWAGLWRKPLRTTLITLALVVAFVLFGLLEGINAGFNAVRDSARMQALLVQTRYGIPMPVMYKHELSQMAGVKTVTAQANMGGLVNGDPEKRVGFNFVDDGYFDFYTYIDIAPDVVAKLRATRTGVVLGRMLADTLELKPGDRFMLKGQLATTGGGTQWPLEVIAVVDRKDIANAARFAIGNLEYLNEMRATGKDTMNQFLVVIEDPDRAIDTSKIIDDRFLNSGAPTRTVIEKVRAEQQYDDDTTHVMVNSIVLAALFSLLLMTGNSMMQSFRERIPQFGALKAIGFTDRQVLAFIAVEAGLQCVPGAAVGLGLARLLVPYTKSLLTGPTGNMMVSGWVIGLGLVVSALVALISAAIPAWRARRLEIVEALAVRT